MVRHDHHLIPLPSVKLSAPKHWADAGAKLHRQCNERQGDQGEWPLFPLSRERGGYERWSIHPLQQGRFAFLDRRGLGSIARLVVQELARQALLPDHRVRFPRLTVRAPISGSPSSARRRRKSGACCRLARPRLFDGLAGLLVGTLLLRPAAPGCGGRRLKSGGIVSGARDSTANSSGDKSFEPDRLLQVGAPGNEQCAGQAKKERAMKRRARGARNRYSQDMAQIPPHPVFSMRFRPLSKPSGNSGSGGGPALIR